MYFYHGLLARDSGILYHVRGEKKKSAEAQAQTAIWPKAIEFQIMEGSTGDVILLGGSALTVNGEPKSSDQFDRFNKTPWKEGWAAYKAPVGFRDPGKEIEKPHGEWNVLEMLADADHVRYWVDGTLVMEGTDASVSRLERLALSRKGQVPGNQRSLPQAGIWQTPPATRCAVFRFGEQRQ